jgi:hypothetical protein
MGIRQLGLSRAFRLVSASALVAVMSVWSPPPLHATITQGDFSVYGFLETRESGRWGEGGAKENGTPSTSTFQSLPGPLQAPGSLIPTATFTPGRAATESGGSFDFNHWDLVQMRQLADIRPEYHMVKDYKFLGRLDTVFLRDADFFAFYRPWYDAFGTLKDRGRAEPNRDWRAYTQLDLQHEYFRDDLREFYGQLNFNDWFSMRVGKQEIIWSEADALSGTELTNSSDLTYHWTHFETPENLRKNVRMVKFNFILPDLWKTANNELEAFVIPGDYQGGGTVVNASDSRLPWEVALPLTAAQGYNQNGQPIRGQTLLDGDQKPMIFVPAGSTVAGALGVPGLSALPGGLFFDEYVKQLDHPPSNSLANSEFGARFSTLLPIGDGLQTSLIYLYEARSSRLGLCTACTPQQLGVPAGANQVFVQPGVFLVVTPGTGVFGKARPGVPKEGTAYVLLSQDTRRNHFLGLTGTYYEKNFTDMVFRYDALWAPKVGVFLANPKTRSVRTDNSSSAWTEQSRFILAGDRPTYIPWISKQHTFLIFQYVATWYPDLKGHTATLPFDTAGKMRRFQSFGFVGAVNWLMNGQLTTTNVYAWDFDDRTGFFSSTNVFRYSRDILFGLNAQWYLGQSGRFTDPLLLSRDQRISELEASITYEL